MLQKGVAEVDRISIALTAISNNPSVAYLLEAMKNHQTSAEVQEHACWALNTLAAGHQERRSLVCAAGGIAVIAGGIVVVLDAMKNHQANAEVQGQACRALSSLLFDNQECGTLVCEAGGIIVVLDAMKNHQANAGVQEQACFALRNLTSGNQECKTLVCEAGGIVVILDAMKNHQGNAGVQEKACFALRNLADRDHSIGTLIAKAGGVSVVLDAMGRSEQLMRAGSLVLPSLLTERAFQMEVESNNIMLDLFLQAEHDDNLLYTLSRLSPDRLEALARSQPDDFSRLLGEVEERRYGCLSTIKDTYLPSQDMVFDIANLVSLLRDGRFQWLSCIGGGMAFNGVATAAIEYFVMHNPFCALMNIFTFGLYGFLMESHRCYTEKSKGLGLLLAYKLAEAVESVVSFLVTAHTVVVAGNIEGYPSLSTFTAALRWGSLTSSLLCLPLLGLDVAKFSLRKEPDGDSDQIRAFLGTSFGKVVLLAFHASELAGGLIYPVFALTTRKLSHYSILAIMIPLFMTMLCCAWWHTRKNIRAIERKPDEKVVLVLMLIIASVYTFGLNFRLGLAFKERGCLAGVSFEAHAAWIRPAFWIAAWCCAIFMAVHNEEMSDMPDSTTLLACASAAALAFLIYLPTSLVLWMNGKWKNASSSKPHDYDSLA